MPSIIENPRVALYARVSTEEQKEGQTIESQVAELERSAGTRNWSIAGVYKDEGWSGSLLARPALDRLRDDATKQLFNIALINDVDRLARDVTHLGVIKRDLERHGVQVAFVKLPTEISPTQNLMVNILGSFAEFERELIVDRTRRGRKHKIEVRKQFLGSIPAYGYRYVRRDRASGKDGLLELEPEEAVVIRQMFQWVDAEGLSARKVLERLNVLHIPPRKKGAGWGKSSVLRILRSEIYAGVWHYNKLESCEPARPSNPSKYRRLLKTSTRLRDRRDWLPLVLPENLRIIPRDQWKRVQNQLDRNIAFSSRNTKHRYLLSGLIQCGGCLASYVGDPVHGKYYYRCSKRCKQRPTLKEEGLNETVWGSIYEALLDPGPIIASVETLNQLAEYRAETEGERSREVSTALQQLETEESRLLEAYRHGVLTVEQLGRQLEEIKIRRSLLEKRGAEISETIPKQDPSQIRRSISDFCRIALTRIRELDFSGRQRLLRLVVRKILLDENYRIRIKGIIPRDNRSPEASPSWEPIADSESYVSEASELGRIATTPIGLLGRNPGREYRYSDSTDLIRDPALPYSFEIEKAIIRPPRPENPRNEFGRYCRKSTNAEREATA